MWVAFLKRQELAQGSIDTSCWLTNRLTQFCFIIGKRKLDNIKTVGRNTFLDVEDSDLNVSTLT